MDILGHTSLYGLGYLIITDNRQFQQLCNYAILCGIIEPTSGKHETCDANFIASFQAKGENIFFILANSSGIRVRTAHKGY
jgi:hypothetical protein